MDLPQLSCGWCIKLDDCEAGGWWPWGRLWCAEPCIIGIFWEDIGSPQGEIMGKFIIGAGAGCWESLHKLAW